MKKIIVVGIVLFAVSFIVYGLYVKSYIDRTARYTRYLCNDRGDTVRTILSGQTVFITDSLVRDTLYRLVISKKRYRVIDSLPLYIPLGEVKRAIIPAGRAADTTRLLYAGFRRFEIRDSFVVTFYGFYRAGEAQNWYPHGAGGVEVRDTMAAGWRTFTCPVSSYLTTRGDIVTPEKEFNHKGK